MQVIIHQSGCVLQGPIPVQKGLKLPNRIVIIQDDIASRANSSTKRIETLIRLVTYLPDFPFKGQFQYKKD